MLVEKIDIQKLRQLSPAKKNEKIYHVLKKITDEEKIVISDRKMAALVKEIYEETFEYGPMSGYMNDENITEIMINNFDRVYIEKKGAIERADSGFKNNQHIKNFVEKLVSPQGLRIDESSPMVDARLDNGARINAVIRPASVSEIAVTIRKFKNDLLTADDLIALNALNHEMSEFLKACVENKVNIFVSGGTSSGKTTFLNVLSGFIPQKERMVTIEETPELNLSIENTVKLEARHANIEGRGEITIRDLVKNALRMRPDRIIIGEIRGTEALDVLNAMNTGHEGSMTTIHANSPSDVVSRLETMILMSSLNLNSAYARRLILSSVNLVVQLERFPDGRRKVVKICELTEEKSGAAENNNKNITVKDIFTFSGDVFVYTGYVPEFFNKAGYKRKSHNAEFI